MSNTGQNTGMSKTVKKVIKNDVQTALKHECQNLNSGSFRAKGLQKNERGVRKSLSFRVEDNHFVLSVVNSKLAR